MDTQIGSAVRLRLLGGFELTGAGTEIPAQPRRILRSLISLLALAPAGGWPRDELCHLLWGERDTEQARASLRQALAEVRRLLGDTSIVTDRDTAAFNPLAVHVDAIEFARLVKMKDDEGAAAIYRGDFLDGVSVSGGAFADWLLVERTRLHDMAAEALSRLVERQKGETAIATAQRLLTIEPFREETHRTLMRLYWSRGDRSVALKQYQTCRQNLERELGVSPDAETEGLFRQIQQQASPGDRAPEAASRKAETLSAAAATRSRPSVWGRVVPGIVAAVGLVAGAAWFANEPPQPAQKPLVAVMPFEAIAGDADSKHLALGLTEEIITDLARVPEFQVMARHATATLAGTAATAQDIGGKLNASYIVQGSIQRQGDELRITAQLSDTASNKSLWSDRWQRPVADLFAIQAEISEKITNRLSGGNGLIQAAGRVAAHRKPPGNLSAYELYLLGTEKLEQINQPDVEEAIVLLRRAVALDPGLARAWIELHNAHAVLANMGGDMEANYKLAEEAAIRALELDPGDPEAHMVRGFSYGYANDFVRAEEHIRRALSMAPNQWETLTFYISWAPGFGEAERGAELVEEAIRLNPAYPMWAARMYAYAYFMVGRYQDALKMMERVDNDSLGTWMWPYKAGALAAVGRTEEAGQAVAETLRRYPHITIEGTANEPSYTLPERMRVIETMRLAGFPPCAKPEDLAKVDKPLRLKECGGSY